MTVQTEIGELPPEWNVRRFDDLFHVQQGKQVSKRNRTGDNVHPFLRTKNVYWGRLDLSELDEMHFTSVEEDRLSLRPGDLLICEGGDIGRTAIWENGPVRCYYQNHLHRARLREPGSADARFVLYWFWYAFEIGKVYFGRGNVTTIPNLSQSKLSELPIPIPTAEEQGHIASLLRLVQDAIEQQEQLLALTGELKKTLLAKLFTEGVHGESVSDAVIGLVPSGWSVDPLGMHLTLAQYGTSLRGGANGRSALLRMTNQRDGRISGEDLQFVDMTPVQFASFRLERGDLLFNRTNSFELVGRTALFDLEGEFTFASYLIRLRTDPARLRPAFLNHYFNWDATQARLKSIATRAVSQSNISATRLRGFAVPVPPVEEQDRIVEWLDVLDTKFALHRRQKTVLEDLFRTLLHQLMTAQLRVHDLDLSALESTVAA